MLQESRLLNFYDSKNGFTISFFEGQKVIHDLAIIHDVKNQGFQFFRNSVLSSLPLVNFLKPQENMGLFIDSDTPYFRLKIEMNAAGYMRTLLLPETFDEMPKLFTGKVRQVKMFPHSTTPYTTIMDAKSLEVEHVINKVLKDSYQLNSHIEVSDNSDQAILISRLPEKNVDKEVIVERASLKDFWAELQPKVNEIFIKASNDEKELIKEIESLGFEYLKSQEIKFKCNCSRDRMVSGIASLTRSNSLNDIFENKESLEAKCDYCKTNYLITLDEIKALLNLKH